MSYKLFRSIGTRLVLDRSKVIYQQKISKRKKPITWPFEAQIVSRFFPVFKGHYKLTLDGVFRERRMHLVPPIVDIGFLYPKLSKVFYRQYSLKNFKIWCCRSCCIQDQLLMVIWNLWVRSQSHKRECLCAANPRKKESMDLDLAHGRISKLLLEVSNWFMIKSDCKNFDSL